MTKRNRFSPAVRKSQIVAAALALAGVHGYGRVTRDQIAVAAGCSTGLVSTFGTMTNLRRDIVRAAVQSQDLVVLGQALAARDPHAQAAPDELKRRALDAALNAV